MIVVNGGLPRSGTVLTGLLIRKLLERRKINFTALNLHGDQVSNFLSSSDSLPERRFGNYLIHTHTWDDRLACVPGQTVTFWNYREARDVLVSLMTLHDLNFEEARDFTIRSINDGQLMADRYRFLVPYETLIADKRAYIHMIASALGFSIGFPEVDAILEETTIEKSRADVEAVKSGPDDKVNLIQNTRRTLREDKQTFLNDRHIQNGGSERYKSELSAPEIAAATSALAPYLKKYGYPCNE